MNKNLILLGVSFFLFFSCTIQEENKEANNTLVPRTKVVNTSANAVKGELIVRFTPEGARQIETSLDMGSDKQIQTNSIDNLLGGIDLESINRVFTITPKTEERSHRAGLHLWFVLRFSQEKNLEQVLETLSSLPFVEIVEFNTTLVKNTVGKTYSYKPSARTKSKDLPMNDAYLVDQWHYNNTGDTKFAEKAVEGADVNVFDAWSMSTGDPSIIVAVLDEAVQYNHPDLAANMWVNEGEIPGDGIDNDGNGYIDDVHGFDFVNNGELNWDNRNEDGQLVDQGHGTHVAGVVAAVNNNGIGVSGIAGGSGKGDGVKIMSCQIFADIPATSMSTANAVKYAADNGASILQCSYGRSMDMTPDDNAYATSSPLELAAYEYFLDTKNNDVLDGGLIIFAAGNDHDPRATYPGAYRKFISVSSISADHLPTHYTNFGVGVNITATGGSFYTAPNEQPHGMVLSTMVGAIDENGSEYAYKEGTSMACPHVSGIAALGLSYAKKLGKTFSVEEFKSMLLTSVNDIDVYLEGFKHIPYTINLPQYKKKLGTGLIDATQFCLQIEGAPMLRAKVNVNQFISLSDFFGGSSDNLTYLGVEISEEAKAKLGITTDPEIKSGKLNIKCTKPGYARIKVRAIAGGSNLATPEDMGGMEISKEIAIIARAVHTENDGWL